MDAILGEVTLHKRRKKLDEMTKGESLGDAYGATISRMKAQQRGKSEIGMEVLMWVSHSERPLHVDELCHALGVEKGSLDLNNQNIPAIETLLACSLGLVIVEKSSSTVRLAHYTLQEYLSYHSGLFFKPHSMISEVCLTYLNFRHVKDFSSTLCSIPSTIPFVKYASCYWGTHARQGISERAKRLALELLNKYDEHISSKMLLLHGMDNWDRPFDQEDSPGGFSGLHGAAYLGCEEITVALLGTNKWDVNATDFNGNTAIAWAARRGNEGVVRMLLEQNSVDPNTTDTEYGRTPLFWAACNGHEGVMGMLLKQNNIDPNRTSAPDGQTPLLWAARNGHEWMVRMLLKQNDINPNTADKHGRTPLSWAAGSGHEGIVRMLLERGGIDPNAAGTAQGETPLLWAAESGQEGVVRILLEQNDLDPNTADTEYCRTPLSWAAGNGYEGVVRMLLEQKDINPNTADKHGRTPLSWAAGSGHEGIVRMLLERGSVDPNTADTAHGQTPLSWAAENGHQGVVRMLLERNDVDPNTADTQHQTPLSWATQNGHEGVVRILLERRGIDPNTADDEFGRTPLQWAARNGHQGIAKLLQERVDLAGYEAGLQSTELFSPESSKLSEPPSKGGAQILISKDGLTVSPSMYLICSPSRVANLSKQNLQPVTDSSLYAD